MSHGQPEREQGRPCPILEPGTIQGQGTLGCACVRHDPWSQTRSLEEGDELAGGEEEGQ